MTKLRSWHSRIPMEILPITDLDCWYFTCTQVFIYSHQTFFAPFS